MCIVFSHSCIFFSYILLDTGVGVAIKMCYKQSQQIGNTSLPGTVKGIKLLMAVYSDA